MSISIILYKVSSGDLLPGQRKVSTPSDSVRESVVAWKFLEYLFGKTR